MYGETKYCEKSRLYQPWTNRLYQPVVIAERCMSKDLSILRPEISQLDCKTVRIFAFSSTQRASSQTKGLERG